MSAPEELLQGGRYQLLGKLGEGGQGTTFDAIDKREGRPVAIKRFSVRGAASWKDVELAEREATVLASLSHPALPAHVDHFEEGGALYLVMSKIEGQNLASIAKSGGTLSQAEVVRFLREAAGLLAYLHGRSPPVIHRDINPKNVVRRPDGSFVLVDFGAVRDRLRPEGGSTVVGTFGYMAPEQFQGRAVPGSDVYAVGATAIRLLTGVEPEKLPHKGLALDVPAALGRGFDPELRAALERMLEPDPDKRASSLMPLVERLERAQERARKASEREAPPSRETRARESRERSENTRGRRTSGGPRQRVDVGDLRDWSDWGDWGNWNDWQDWTDRKHFSRQQRRAWKRARRNRRRGRPLFGPPLYVALLGLTVARLVVMMVVGVAVPILLMVLSLFFGRALRDAARRTRMASADARNSLGRAQSYLWNGPAPAPVAPGPDDEETSAPRTPPPPRARVRVEPDDDLGRGDDSHVVDTTGVEVKSETSGRGR